MRSTTRPVSPKGTSWHPHRGFETVTYMIDGQMAHQDSHGGGGLITNGDTQWMTAGAGILHIETPPEHLVISGGLFHGVQLWVNLPRSLKFAQPRYQDIRGHDVALLSSSDGGALVRVIAGELAGHAGPGSTHTPITLVHATVSPGASVTLPWPPDFNALAYALAGGGTVGAEQRPIHSGQLAVFGHGDVVTVGSPAGRDSDEALDVLVLGGLPIREPIAAVRAVRDEHEGGDPHCAGGLPGGTARHDPRRARRRGGRGALSPGPPAAGRGRQGRQAAAKAAEAAGTCPCGTCPHLPHRPGMTRCGPCPPAGHPAAVQVNCAIATRGHAPGRRRACSRRRPRVWGAGAAGRAR